MRYRVLGLVSVRASYTLLVTASGGKPDWAERSSRDFMAFKMGA